MNTYTLPDYIAGRTLYMAVFDTEGRVWNGTSFVSTTSVTWPLVAVAMAESPAGTYTGTMPGAIGPGVYTLRSYHQYGPQPDRGDGQISQDTYNYEDGKLTPLGGAGGGEGGLQYIFESRNPLVTDSAADGVRWLNTSAGREFVRAGARWQETTRRGSVLI